MKNYVQITVSVLLALTLIATPLVPPVSLAVAQTKIQQPNKAEADLNFLPGYTTHVLTDKQAAQRVQQLVKSNPVVANSVDELKRSRSAKSFSTRSKEAPSPINAISLVAVPNGSFQTSLDSVDSLDSADRYEVTLISSQTDVDYESQNWEGIVYRRAPGGASDVWAATLFYGSEEVVVVDAVRLELASRRLRSPFVNAGYRALPVQHLNASFTPFVHKAFPALFTNNAAFGCTMQCIRHATNACQAEFNRDIVTYGGGAILGALQCTGLSGATLVTVCAGAAAGAYIYGYYTARQSRNWCNQRAIAACCDMDEPSPE